MWFIIIYDLKFSRGYSSPHKIQYFQIIQYPEFSQYYFGHNTCNKKPRFCCSLQYIARMEDFAAYRMIDCCRNGDQNPFKPYSWALGEPPQEAENNWSGLSFPERVSDVCFTAVCCMPPDYNVHGSPRLTTQYCWHEKHPPFDLQKVGPT